MVPFNIPSMPSPLFSIWESTTDNLCTWNNIFSQRSWESRILNCPPQLKDAIAASERRPFLPTATTLILSPTSRINRAANFWQVDGWSQMILSTNASYLHFFLDFIEICILVTSKLDHRFSFLGILERLFHNRESCWGLVVLGDCPKL